jgi:hypothetical protein
MPAELAARYRGYGAACLLLARGEEKADQKLVLIDMAQAWIVLAEQAEKYESLFMAYEVPRTEDAS